MATDHTNPPTTEAVPTVDALEQQRPADPEDTGGVPATSTGIEEPASIAEQEDTAAEADLIEQHQEAGSDPEDRR
ncbi:MAG: hypothetical protein ACTHNS_07825 [Marmoricola sp.]